MEEKAKPTSMGKPLYNLKRYFGHYKGYSVRLTLGVLGSIGYALALLPIPMLFKRIIDQRIPAGDTQGMLLDSGIILGLYLAFLGLSVGGKYFILWVTKQVTLKLRAESVEKLQQLAIGYYDKEDLGKLHSRIIQDTEKIDVMSNFIVSVLLVSAVTAIGTLALMIWMSWKLSVLVVIATAVFGVFAYMFRETAKARYKLWRESFDTFSSQVQELIQSIRLVRAYASEDRENSKVYETSSALTDRGIKMVTFFTIYGGVMETLMGLGQVVVIFGGGWLVMHGEMSMGAMVAYFFLLTHMFNPVRAILVNMEQAYAGTVALDSLYEHLDHDHVEPDRLTGIEKRVEGKVEFENVSFEYEPGRPVLRDTSVIAEPGKSVALVGQSGAGKTTFINLVQGFYSAQSGLLKIDGVDILDYQSKSLRSQMAVVSQDNIILSGTVLTNIMYGKPNATQDEVELAARLALAHEFIKDLPKGYNTEVGDRGVRLSGGQKQRIAIARAILRNPRILILDEATSALDTASERLVQEALNNLMKDRTTFIIAHRLSTVKNASEILVFDGGRVVERGNHSVLLKQGGIYAGLFGAQFEVA